MVIELLSNMNATKPTLMRCVFHVFGVYAFLTFGNACGPSEYKSADGKCCPICNIGSVVHRDCVGDSNTTCIPCTPGTFMSEPNGFKTCFSCKTCEQSQGLYLLNTCSTIRNSICDVLDGYYCLHYSDHSSSQCVYAQKHSVCKPGQDTKKAGSKSSDSVCEDCPNGFYSPSGLNCTKWTDCASRNEVQIEDGSPVKDVTCAQTSRKRYGLIPALVLAALATCCCCLSHIFCYRRSKLSQSKKVKKNRVPVEETPVFTKSGRTPEENKEEEVITDPT